MKPTDTIAPAALVPIAVMKRTLRNIATSALATKKK